MKLNYLPSHQELNTFADDRGVFVPFLNNAEVLSSGKKNLIKRIYYIYNFGMGVIRGFHFHKKEWKYFTVVSGSAKFIAINPKNPKQIFTFISSDRKANLIIIPPGFANGWVSLENNTILVCASTSSLEESLKDDKRFDPYRWGKDIWKVRGR